MEISRILLPERDALPRLIMASFKHAFLHGDYVVAQRLLESLQHTLLSPGRASPANAAAMAALLEEIDQLQAGADHAWSDTDYAMGA